MTQPRGGDQGSFLETERQDWVLKNVYLAGREENQACIVVWSPVEPQRAWGARRLCERQGGEVGRGWPMNGSRWAFRFSFDIR